MLKRIKLFNAKNAMVKAVKRQARADAKQETLALMKCDTKKIGAIRKSRQERVHEQLRREVYGK